MSAAPANDTVFEPWDIPTEQSVLGNLMVHNRLIDVAAADMDASAFYDGLHQRLFSMIVALHGEDGSVNPVRLHAVMKRDPGLIQLGGVAYLANLAAAAASPAALPGHIRVLKDLAMRREVILVGEDILAAAGQPPHEMGSRAIAEAATERLLLLGEQREHGPSQLSTVAHASVVDAEERLAGKKVIQSITTGSAKLDAALGGMQPGDRIGIAARTGMGKSLTLSAICNAAARAGAPVFLACADMRKKQWADRALCDIDAMLNPDLRPIYYSKFRTGTLTTEEVYRIAMAQREMDGWAFDIDDNPVITLASVRSRVRAMARRYPKKQGLLGIDFLQKVEAAKSGYQDKRRDEDLTAIAYGLGDIVRQEGWSLLALLQMKNKATDGKGNLQEDPPHVGDIRESGGIEMALDIIMSPFRKAFFIGRRNEDQASKSAALNETAPCGWQVRHHLQMLGFKNRDGDASDLNLDLWCDPGCAALRDEKPGRNQTATEQAQADLLRSM